MRAITFPKTGDGEWTNGETGARIVRRHVTAGGGYKVRDIWGNGIDVYPTFTAALIVAKGYVENVVRPKVAYDHELAIREDGRRTAEQARKIVEAIPAAAMSNPKVASLARTAEKDAKSPAEALAYAKQARDLAITVTSEIRGLCLRVEGFHVGHMQAVNAECRDEQGTIDGDVEGTCTRGSSWTIPHPFEYDVLEVKQAIAGNDGYDEFERCGKAPSDPTHVTAEWLNGCTYSGDGWHLPHPYQYDKSVIDQRIATGDESTRCGGHQDDDRHDVPSTQPDVPPAPADLNDDPAWQAYAAALPTPSTDEYAAVLAEFGDPYAEQTTHCVDLFKTTARRLWHERSQGYLTDGAYRTYRLRMQVSRESLSMYRRMSLAWARRTAESYAS